MAGMMVCFQSLGKVKRRKLHKFVSMPSIPFITVYSSFQGNSTYDFSSKNRLFVELGQHHIAIYVIDPSSNTLIDLEMVKLNEELNSLLLQTYLEEKGINPEKCRNINLVLNTKEFALIPSNLYNPSFNRHLIETIHGDMLDLQLSADELSFFDAVNVYGVQREINTVLDRFFPNANRKHKNACYVKDIASQLDALPPQIIKIFFSPSHIDVLIVKNSTLQFIQKFYYETTDDLLYYILTLTEKFNLDKKSLFVYLSGIIDLDALILFEFRKHFVTIEIEHKQFSISNHIKDIPGHFITPLMISSQCV
jgi:hypothetical protein